MMGGQVGQHQEGWHGQWHCQAWVARDTLPGEEAHELVTTLKVTCRSKIDSTTCVWELAIPGFVLGVDLAAAAERHLDVFGVVKYGTIHNGMGLIESKMPPLGGKWLRREKQLRAMWICIRWGIHWNGRLWRIARTCSLTTLNHHSTFGHVRGH